MSESTHVHPWPLCATSALRALQSEAACAVISIASPLTENRTLARLSIRKALGELLAAYWQMPAQCIALSSRIGEALTVLSPASTVGVSISHAPGCSIAAVHLHGPVGVDVARIDTAALGGTYGLPDWDRLAQDYLGPVTHQQLVHTAPAERAQAFAHAWCRLEASLKCLGQGLTEWTPTLGHTLERCQSIALDLPDTLCGALALGPAKQGPASSG